MVHLVRVELAVGVDFARVVAERGAVFLLFGQPLSLRGMGQVGEHHRSAQHVHRIILPTEPVIVQTGDQVRALAVKEIPHALAQQRERVLGAFEIRGVAEEPRENRADCRPHAQLADGVLLILIVDAHLCGRRTAHHAQTILPDTPQIIGHRLVPALRVDRNVGVAGVRLVTVVDQAEVQRVKNRIDLVTEAAVNLAQLLRIVQHADRAFDLGARLQGDGDSLAGEAYQMAVLPILLVGIVIGAQTIEQDLNPVRLVIVDRLVGTIANGQMLDFNPVTVVAFRLGAAFEETDQAVDMLGVDGGIHMRVADAWCAHAAIVNEIGPPRADCRALGSTKN